MIAACPSTARVVRAVAVTLMIAGGASCGEPTAPGRGVDQLIFTSSREGVMQGSAPLVNIFRMNADGSEVVNLTNVPGWYDNLVLTPDGRSMVFQATTHFGSWTGDNCPLQVWSMRVDGSGLRQLTTAGCSYSPRPSPDGRHVAYLRDNEVWVVGADGKGARHVTYALPNVTPNACGETPRTLVRPIGWVSADRILFERHICGQGTTFYTVDLQGNGLREIEFDGPTAYLSPDGSRIAYNVDPFSDAALLVVMDADGTNARTVASSAKLPNRHSFAGTVWSPDGSHLYYYSSQGHFVVSADGSTTRRLADPWPAFRGFFDGWSADGSQISFTLSDDAVFDVAVMNADGTGLVNLTAEAAGSSGMSLWIRR